MSNSLEAPGARTLGVFALAVVLGGANFVGVRFSNLELAPFWGAGLRFSLAALSPSSPSHWPCDSGGPQEGCSL